jgi:hypothetical protein
VRVVVIALVLALSATAARADDDPLAVAMRLESALDYEGALQVIERELARGGANRDHVVNLHMFAGRLAAGLDRTAAAEDHFARVLALSPTSSFAPGTSPKITNPFDAARARTKRLVVLWGREGDTVFVQARDDVNAIVTGVSVSFVRGAGETSSVSNNSGLSVSVPAEVRVTEVVALDRYGNRVWVSPVDERETVVGGGPERPLYRRWTLWAAATVVLASGTGVCMWRFTVAQDEFHDAIASGTKNYTEVQAIERRGNRWGLAANIGIGTVALSTVITFIVAGASPSAPTTYPRTAVRPMLTAEGGGLTVVGAF